MTTRHSKTLTEDSLSKIAWAARDRLVKNRDAENGDCEPVSDAIVAALKRAGHKNALTMTGSYQGEPRAWVSVGPYFVDATHDQFQYTADEDDEACYADNPVIVGRGLGPDDGSPCRRV